MIAPDIQRDFCSVTEIGITVCAHDRTALFCQLVIADLRLPAENALIGMPVDVIDQEIRAVILRKRFVMQLPGHTDFMVDILEISGILQHSDALGEGGR